MKFLSVATALSILSVANSAVVFTTETDVITVDSHGNTVYPSSSSTESSSTPSSSSYEAPSSSTYEAPSSTYEAPSSTYEAPSSTYEAPSSTYEAPSSSAPAPTSSPAAPSSSSQPQPTSSSIVNPLGHAKLFGFGRKSSSSSSSEPPATSEAPETSEAPATSEAPETTEAPETSEAPETPEAPSSTQIEVQESSSSSSSSTGGGFWNPFHHATTLVSKTAWTSTYQVQTSTSSTAEATSSASSGGTASDGFESNILDAHNAKRALHGVAALSWDNDAYEYAQNYANKYDCSGVLTHSGGKYGENLGIGYKDGAAVVEAWYDEGKNYDYSVASSLDHFTQVIWKSTTRVGCAVRDCSSQGHGKYYICSYDPAGNMIGEGKSNLFKTS